MPKRTPRQSLRTASATTLTGLATTFALLGCTASENDRTPQTTTRPSGQPVAYADDVYTATGEYGSQPSHITVTLTLSDNVITAVTVTPHATNPTSLDYQRRLAQAVPRLVTGRPIADLHVAKTAGSSGTPEGFNDAIAQIRDQAIR